MNTRFNLKTVLFLTAISNFLSLSANAKGFTQWMDPDSVKIVQTDKKCLGFYEIAGSKPHPIDNDGRTGWTIEGAEVTDHFATVAFTFEKDSFRRKQTVRNVARAITSPIWLPVLVLTGQEEEIRNGALEYLCENRPDTDYTKVIDVNKISAFHNVVQQQQALLAQAQREHRRIRIAASGKIELEPVVDPSETEETNGSH